jgi:hypothetical protein
LDHFVGLQPADSEKPATIFTTKLRVTDQPLRITADAEGGSIRLAVIDDVGLGIDEANEIKADLIDGGVIWKGQGFSEHIGKDVHLQFELKNATLWSIQGVDLVNTEMPPKLNPLKNPHLPTAPVSSRTVSFDQNGENWKGVDQITHHGAGGVKGGYVSVSRPGRSLPIAASGSGSEQTALAGNWHQVFGGREASISCQVRSKTSGGKVQIEIFAGDVAPWHFETEVPFGSEWREAEVRLRYDWSDEQAEAAGWKRSATGFTWAETIQNVGKVVIVPVAAGALDTFDLDEVTSTGLKDSP